MAIEALIASMLGYLVANIKKSKGGKKAADEMSTAIWDWVSPIFLKDNKEDEALTDLKADPDDPDNQDGARVKIKKYIKKNPSEEAKLRNLITKLEASDEQSASIKIVQNHSGTGDNIAGNQINYGTKS